MKKMQTLSGQNVSSLKKIVWPLLVVLLGVLLSWHQYRSIHQQSERTLEARFSVAFNKATLDIVEKVEAYEQMLRATQGFFYASDEVSREEFRRFSQELELDSFYDGLLGLGYAQQIAPQDKAEHITKIRESGFPKYTIYPEGPRDFYTSIVFLEPFVDRNLRAFGYDMASEKTRREAMLRAREQRQVALSGGVKLVQDLASETTTGLLMYLPVSEEPESDNLKVSEPREHLGWVYVVFRIEDVVKSTLDADQNISHFRVNDITEDVPQTLFQSAKVSSSDVLMQQKVMELSGRRWQFEASPDVTFVANYEDNASVIGLLLGIFFSFALAYIAWLMINGRIRAETIATQMTHRLREQNQRLSLATETARIGIWDWNFDTDTLFLDKNLADSMGLQRSESLYFSYQEWFQAVDAGDQPKLQVAIGNAIAQRSELSITLKVYPQESVTCIVQLNAVLRFDNEGVPTGMVGVSFDITDSWLHQKQLTETEARWKHALEGTGEGVWDWTPQDNYVIFSDKLITMLGYEPEEFEPNASAWTDKIHPDDQAQVEKDVEALLDVNQSDDYANEHRLRCKDGSWKWILARGTVIERDDQGNALRAVGTHSDISLRKAMEINLRQSEEHFHNAFNTAPIGIALVSTEGRWLEVNKRLCEMLGYPESELLELTFADITHPDDLDEDLEHVQRLIAGELDHYQMEKRYFQKHGQIIDVLLSVSVVHDDEGNVMHFVSQIEDITDRKREQERIRTMAFQDALTQLPNRRLFEERIAHALKTAIRNKQQLALMFIDIDHFKQINDTYGHDVGDEVIKSVAKTMNDTLRASDTLARLGGDEFVVLLSDVPSGEVAVKVAENLRTPLKAPLQLDSTEIKISLSIGVAIWTPETNDSMVNFMKKADIALYDVKARGRDGVALYRPKSDKSGE